MTEPQTPEEFDLDSWIAGTTRPTVSVPLTQRGDLLGQMDVIAHKIRIAEAVEQASGTIETDLAGTEESSETLRHQYAALAEAYGASALMFTFRTLDGDEWQRTLEKAVAAGHDPADGREMTLWTLADALVSPELDVEGLRRVRDAVGDTQWHQLVGEYNKLKSGLIGPSADFLPSASSSQEPDEY